jgi:hypothetical protein
MRTARLGLLTRRALVTQVQVMSCSRFQPLFRSGPKVPKGAVLQL